MQNWRCFQFIDTKQKQGVPILCLGQKIKKKTVKTEAKSMENEMMNEMMNEMSIV